jgi:hypothetical protein
MDENDFTYDDIKTLLASNGYTRDLNYMYPDELKGYLPFVDLKTGYYCFLGHSFLESELSPVSLDYKSRSKEDVNNFIQTGTWPIKHD